MDVERRAVAREDAIKILLIDDSPIDAELNLMALRRGGVRYEHRIAGNEAELRAVLAVFEPDLVLCDFRLPDLDGFAAQALVREAYADLPLIFVTGAITEDHAVIALKSGAVDYVLKSNLLRLPMAATRAVQESRERRRLEVSLEDSQERARQHAARLETLWRIANNPDVRGG